MYHQFQLTTKINITVCTRALSRKPLLLADDLLWLASRGLWRLAAALAIPFHHLISGNEQTQHKKTENQYKAQKTHKHIYTTRSNFNQALLLALQRAASDFLALSIKTRQTSQK